MFENPFRPGAGHMPPHMAGRRLEQEEFSRLLRQDVVLENLVLTGLRGVGKTVLLDTLKPLAIEQGWAWVGTDLSESASITEDRLTTRIAADLSVLTSSLVVQREQVSGMGYRPEVKLVEHRLDYETMLAFYRATPGLAADKLKAVLELVWQCLKTEKKRGLIFAYDESQNLSDHAAKEEYPLSLMLDVFQSIQKKGIPMMLVLVGLPTLFPKLVEARTFAERMFRVLFLDRLSDQESREAVLKPLEDASHAKLADFITGLVDVIVNESAGYPYFIQFICREIVDLFLQARQTGQEALVPIEDIIRKLDSDFFAGRWARATDRQRELLNVIAALPTSEQEFTVQEVAEKSRELLDKPFGPSQVSHMLGTLGNAGLVYKNRHGRYSFAVPLLGRFIRRQQREQSLSRELDLFD